MKILLLGEYSGFYKNLKEGLQEIGYDAKLAANGDGWKKVSGADFLLTKNSKSFLGKCNGSIVYPLENLKNFYGHDVVQVINPIIFHKCLNYFLLKKIKKNNGKFFLSATGDDYYVYKAYENNQYKYFPFDENEKIHITYNQDTWMGRINIKNNNLVLEMCDGVIPTAYEYIKAYEKHPKTMGYIPLPINIDDVSYGENIVYGKIIFFHGLNREVEKGTKYIKSAFDIIKDKYPNDVEVIIDGKLPLNEYLKIMQRTNVIVDQCKSYSWNSMNSLYAMAKGKIVMGGAEREAICRSNLDSVPVVNIKPNVHDIVRKMEWIIENRKNIMEFGYISRKFVEKFHDYRKIAQMYVDFWRTIN